MIDFEKIMNRTPEEKEADQKARYEKFEAKMLSTISSCKEKIEQLVHCLDSMPEKSAKFVRDLEYQSTTFDADGRQGGRLADLSDRQTAYLDSLYKQFVPEQIVSINEVLNDNDDNKTAIQNSLPTNAGMKIIIAGSRGCSNINDVDAAIKASGFIPAVIISGTAKGADKLGEQWAKCHGIPIEQYPADWDTHGKSAGYRRNELMANNADALVAVWDGDSRGTKHMIDIASRKGLEVYVHRLDREVEVEAGKLINETINEDCEFAVTPNCGHPWDQRPGWDLMEVRTTNKIAIENFIKKAESEYWKVWINGVPDFNEKTKSEDKKWLFQAALYKPFGINCEWVDPGPNKLADFEKLQKANTERGHYYGTVVDESNVNVLQNQGRGNVVIHEKIRLIGDPKVGRNVEIGCKDGKGTITSLEKGKGIGGVERT